MRKAPPRGGHFRVVALAGGVGVKRTCDTPRFLDNAFSEGDDRDAKPMKPSKETRRTA